MELRSNANVPGSILTPSGPTLIKHLLKRFSLLDVSGERPLFIINATAIIPKTRTFPNELSINTNHITVKDMIKVGWLLCRRQQRKMKSKKNKNGI